MEKLLSEKETNITELIKYNTRKARVLTDNHEIIQGTLICSLDDRRNINMYLLHHNPEAKGTPPTLSREARNDKKLMETINSYPYSWELFSYDQKNFLKIKILEELFQAATFTNNLTT